LKNNAVRVAGGYNHRMGLYDQVLIKDNHIKASGFSSGGMCTVCQKKTRED